MSNIMTILYSAVGIGVVLMVLALVDPNIYSKFKQREIGEAIFFGKRSLRTAFLRGSHSSLRQTRYFSLSLPTLPLLIIGIIVPIACIWLKEPQPIKLSATREEDWKPESWGGYMTQGFFELFEAVLSYVTNTVSPPSESAPSCLFTPE